jgi:hypothetical protein
MARYSTHRKKIHGRFLFTQLSAIPVFVGISLLCSWLVKPWLEPLNSPSTQKNEIVIPILASVSIWVIMIVVGWWIWSRLLVLWGFLTLKEVKGYPYSRPWE